MLVAGFTQCRRDTGRCAHGILRCQEDLTGATCMSAPLTCFASEDQSIQTRTPAPASQDPGSSTPPAGSRCKAGLQLELLPRASGPPRHRWRRQHPEDSHSRSGWWVESLSCSGPASPSRGGNKYECPGDAALWKGHSRSSLSRSYVRPRLLSQCAGSTRGARCCCWPSRQDASVVGRFRARKRAGDRAGVASS